MRHRNSGRGDPSLRRGRLARLRDDLATGRQDGYPACCRLRFTLTTLLAPDHQQALARGVSTTRNGDAYVPCRVFHHARFTHAEWEQHLNEQPGAPWY